MEHGALTSEDIDRTTECLRCPAYQQYYWLNNDHLSLRQPSPLMDVPTYASDNSNPVVLDSDGNKVW